MAGISSALDYHQLYGQGLALDDMYDSKRTMPARHRPAARAARRTPRRTSFFCIDPDDEEWYRGNDRLSEKLGALGVSFTADLTTQAGGHSWQYFNHMAEPVLRFLMARLTQESRRLL